MRKTICLAAAGVLSCAVIALSAAHLQRNVYALEQAEADASTDPAETSTEAAADALIEAVTHTVVDSLNTSETETEGFNPVGLLPDDVKETLNSLNADEITEYAIMIERILTNPDFQEIMRNHEVQDLLVTLVHNALDMAQDEPVMTTKILETLGIDRRMIAIFFTILQERKENPEAVDTLRKFLVSNQGTQLINRILDTVDEETIEAILNEFNAQLEDGRTGLEALMAAAPADLLAGVVAGSETEVEVQTEAAE